MAKKLLIAGYGFLGKALKPTFENAGWQVSYINRSGRDGAIACDFLDLDALASLPDDFDLIIHCAASGGGTVSDYRNVYLRGIENLATQFLQPRILFTSSTSVYPQQDHMVVTEKTSTESTSERAKILLDAERVALKSGGIVARLSGLYGQGRCHVLKNYLAGNAALDGQGERIMNFVHRDDVASAYLLLAEKTDIKGVYNVNGGAESQREVYQSLATHFGGEIPLSKNDNQPRKRGNTSKRVNSAKLIELGWMPQYQDFLALALACWELKL